MLGLSNLINPGQPRYPEHLEVTRSVVTDPNGTTIPYTDVVNPNVGTKGVALLLPGIHGTEVSEEVAAQAFANLGYVARMPMLRGYGILPERSTRGAGSSFGYGNEGIIAEDLPFMIEKTNDDFSKPVVLFGFSAGALVGANYLSGAVADSTAGQVQLVRDQHTAKERSQKVVRFIDFAGPHGEPPMLPPHKIMLELAKPFLRFAPTYDLRSDSFVKYARDFLLPCHLAMTPWPMRITPMMFTPMAFSLSVYMNPANMTYEDFVRLMYAGFGREEHDDMLKHKQLLLGQGLRTEYGYDFLASAASIYTPTAFINGSFDRISTPEQTKVWMQSMPAGVERRQIVIPYRGHLDSTYGRGAYNPLCAALKAAL